MAAIGWYVGLVHYPSFKLISEASWSSFHSMHTTFTGVLVGPAMILQILCSVLILTQSSSLLIKAGVATCLVLSIGWTAVVSGPIHGQLTTQNMELIDRLVRTNWPRAVAWTAQAILAGWVLLNP